ncbi:ras-related protein Rab-9B-like [Cloeon dipterum]|uniref:ras-related protein Rab-9B-like n=1 Tax=Cloeon dipterum TaxID=197152 RepID=UPI0032207763
MASCSNRLLKLVILGDMGVGKTCLMRRLIYDQFDVNSFPTIGVEFLTKEIHPEGAEHETFTLQIWDTAGQEKFHSLRTPFYRGADVCMLTYNIADRNTFYDLQYWLKEFIFHAGVGANFPYIIVGTKLDLADELRDVPANWAEEWCQAKGIKAICLETSSKTRTNVEEAFHAALTIWIRNSAQSPTSNLDFSFRQFELRSEDLVNINRRQELEERRRSNYCCLKM